MRTYIQCVFPYSLSRLTFNSQSLAFVIIIAYQLPWEVVTTQTKAHDDPVSAQLILAPFLSNIYMFIQATDVCI